MNIRQKMVLRLLCHGTAALFLAGSLLSEATAASNKDSKERQAVRRVQAQLNQVQQQKTLLEQEKTGLAEQLEELKKKSDGLESGVARANARRAALDREVEGLNRDKTELAGKLQETSQEMRKKQAEALQALQHKEQESKRFEAEAARQTSQVEMCEVKNARLYQINVELMDKHQSKGLFGALLQAEPFTQLKSVEMENLLQEYRDKADAERISTSGKSREISRPEARQ